MTNMVRLEKIDSNESEEIHTEKWVATVDKAKRLVKEDLYRNGFNSNEVFKGIKDLYEEIVINENGHLIVYKIINYDF